MCVLFRQIEKSLNDCELCRWKNWQFLPRWYCNRLPKWTQNCVKQSEKLFVSCEASKVVIWRAHRRDPQKAQSSRWISVVLLLWLAQNRTEAGITQPKVKSWRSISVFGGDFALFGWSSRRRLLLLLLLLPPFPRRDLLGEPWQIRNLSVIKLKPQVSGVRGGKPSWVSLFFCNNSSGRQLVLSAQEYFRLDGFGIFFYLKDWFFFTSVVPDWLVGRRRVRDFSSWPIFDRLRYRKLVP